MSMIPNEIPDHEVVHQPEDSEWFDEGYIMFMGHCTRSGLWMRTKKEEDEFDADLKRREKSRAKLGGFGFQPPR